MRRLNGVQNRREPSAQGYEGLLRDSHVQRISDCGNGPIQGWTAFGFGTGWAGAEKRCGSEEVCYLSSGKTYAPYKQLRWKILWKLL